MSARERAVMRDAEARRRLADDPLVRGIARTDPYRRTNTPLLSAEDVEAVRRSVGDGMSLYAIAQANWRKYGYVSAETCKKALQRALAR